MMNSFTYSGRVRLRQWGYNTETGRSLRPTLPDHAFMHIRPEPQGPVDPWQKTSEAAKARVDAEAAKIIAEMRARRAAKQ